MQLGLERCGRSQRDRRGNRKSWLGNRTNTMTRENQSLRARPSLIVALVCSVVSSQAYAQAAPSPPVATPAMPQPVMQANGDVIMMPQNLPVSRRFGLRFEVDTRWVNTYGYRPVEVTVSSPLPTTSAHTITVLLHSGWESTVTAEQDFEFPLGATKASASIALPLYETTYFGVWWEVLVDGKKDIDLSVEKNGASRAFSASNVSTSTVRVLVPG